MFAVVRLFGMGALGYLLNKTTSFFFFVVFYFLFLKAMFLEAMFPHPPHRKVNYRYINRQIGAQLNIDKKGDEEDKVARTGLVAAK
jgi:hypothetical protein